MCAIKSKFILEMQGNVSDQVHIDDMNFQHSSAIGSRVSVPVCLMAHETRL